jgi:hypothetical protein
MANCKHRKNNDNSWDSICPNCSLIIARVDNESELPLHERMHACDPAIFRKPISLSFQLSPAR